MNDYCTQLRNVDTFQSQHVHAFNSYWKVSFHCFHSTFSFLHYSFKSGHEELIQTLTWDGTGSRLLSTDLVGVCKLWAMKVLFSLQNYDPLSENV